MLVKWIRIETDDCWVKRRAYLYENVAAHHFTLRLIKCQMKSLPELINS